MENSTEKKRSIWQKIKTVASRVWAKIQAEPVLVRTILGLLTSAGVLRLTDQDLTRVDAAVMAVVMIASALSARGAVTPLPPEERPRALRKARREGQGS